MRRYTAAHFVTSVMRNLESHGFLHYSLEPVCVGCHGQYELGFVSERWDPFERPPRGGPRAFATLLTANRVPDHPENNRLFAIALDLCVRSLDAAAAAAGREPPTLLLLVTPDALDSSEMQGVVRTLWHRVRIVDVDPILCTGCPPQYLAAVTKLWLWDLTGATGGRVRGRPWPAAGLRAAL